METGLQSEVKIRVRRLRVWLGVICCFYFAFVIFFNYYFYYYYFLHVLCVPVHFFLSMPLIFTLMAASISPFPHRRYKILMFFFRRNWSPLFFTLALALSLLSTTMQTLKLSRKKESALLLLFLLLKVREAMRFTAETCRNVRVLEMQNFIAAYMRGWTYVGTYASRSIFSEPKFLGCIDYQIFLPMLLLYAPFAHARVPLLKQPKRG